MKNRKAKKLEMTTIGIWWLRNILGPMKALYLRRAAQRDERNGFAYTAAMEWRNAAEIIASNSLACEYCWQQWERVMHLPRLLAQPIGTSSDPSLH